MGMTKVEVVQSDDRRRGIRQAVEGLGASFVDKVKHARSILLKVNLVHHENQLASTHIDAVRGVLDVIRAYSRVNVYVGDASYYGTKAAFRNFGYEQLPMEYEHTSLVDLNDDGYVDGYSVRADGSQNLIRRSKLAHDVDLRISLAPMKTHRDAGVSLAVKNWTLGTWLVPPRVGTHGRVWARWPWLNNEGPEGFHGTVASLYQQLPADVAVIDGTVAMEGEGPTRGTPVQMGVLLAGMDPLAVDAVGATLMGFDPQEIRYLVMAAEQDLGTIAMSRIDAPPLLISQLSRQFMRA